MNELNPTNAILADVTFILAKTALKAKDYKDGEEWARKELILLPDNPRIWESLMYALALQHRHKEAVEAAEKALSLDEAIQVRYMKALFKLYLKDYENGFKEIECRWDEGGLKEVVGLELPQWTGQSCKRIHVYAEQGYGDIFMFGRYVPLMIEKFKFEKVYSKNLKEI